MRNKRLMAAVLTCLCLSPVIQATEDHLLKFFLVSKSGVYQPQTASEVERAGELFQRLFASEVSDQLIEAWAELDFRLVEVEPDTWVLIETARRQEGRGFFVVRKNSAGSHLLQAPHRDDDLYTGALAVRLMRTDRFSAAAWNTVPRKQLTRAGAINSDLAALSGTYFTAFARAWLENSPEGLALQLHGFAAKKHPRVSEDFILSGGSRVVSPEVRQYATCLRESLKRPVAIYPEDAQELGGTRNATGRMIRQFDRTAFLHLEMNKSTRKALLRETGEVDKLGQCLP